ncbi:hypothetical protein WOLCODRAFT_152553 [Wolfiporia cocos MD-104 SS10]|uniref:Uncharacterized protein n=1 Tax=Wolfiporia cocos (strain MD-104) TaxID=742152 RepID=A0A2H3JJZ8_WOLCO|nr:hypothetical protein WOLCODRAFT_152553 [Wolfiporia cocos MD-104 SS10]
MRFRRLVDADVELFQDVKKLVQRLQVRKKRVISTVKICLPKLKDLFSELSISDPTSGSFAGESFREVPPAITDDGIEQAAGSFQGDRAPGIHLDSSTFHNTMEPSNASTSDNHGTIGVVNNVVGSDQQEITEDGGNRSA